MGFCYAASQNLQGVHDEVQSIIDQTRKKVGMVEAKLVEEKRKNTILKNLITTIQVKKSVICKAGCEINVYFLRRKKTKSVVIVPFFNFFFVGR